MAALLNTNASKHSSLSQHEHIHQPLSSCEEHEEFNKLQLADVEQQRRKVEEQHRGLLVASGGGADMNIDYLH